jgi:hypothetical protein
MLMDVGCFGQLVEPLEDPDGPSLWDLLNNFALMKYEKEIF